MMDPFDNPMEDVLSMQSYSSMEIGGIELTDGCSFTMSCGTTYDCGFTGSCGMTGSCSVTVSCQDTAVSKSISAN